MAAAASAGAAAVSDTDASALAPERLYGLAEADPAHTLGGIKDDVVPEHPSVVRHLLGSLMPGQDLTRVTIPSWYLEPRSLLERMADTMMHPDLLLHISEMPDPVERIIAVTRWFLSGWHYRTVGIKKPYNPIIGETFACTWAHPDGSRSSYFAEQVLHRPPISAIYFENRRHNVVASAHVHTKSQFQAPQTTRSIMEGACLLRITNLDEEYYITFPNFYAHNLLLGTARMETGDTAHVVCVKTGYRVDLDFLQMTMFSSANHNAVRGKLMRMGAPGAPMEAFAAGKKGDELATFEGRWDEVIFMTRKGSSREVLIDISKTPVAAKMVLPLRYQGPWESRRLWTHATEELTKRPTVNWSVVDADKGQLEEEQRLLPCHLHKPGQAGYEDWPTKKFHKRTVPNPLAGGAPTELFVFDDMKTEPYKDGEVELNLLHLSRTLPDPRGGLGGAGARKDFVEALRSVHVAPRREETWEKFSI